jgi:hypothetical protein
VCRLYEFDAERFLNSHCALKCKKKILATELAEQETDVQKLNGAAGHGEYQR